MSATIISVSRTAHRMNKRCLIELVSQRSGELLRTVGRQISREGRIERACDLAIEQIWLAVADFFVQECVNLRVAYNG